MSVQWPLLAVTAGALSVFFVVAHLLRRMFRKLGRHTVVMADHTHHPFRWFGATAIVQATIGRALSSGWQHLITLVLIATGAWLLTGVLTAVERTAMSRLRIGEPDNLRARRAQTQLAVVRRFTVAIVAVLALGAMLMTFPAARAAGTSLLASAGIIGAIAALAAQSLLGNVFAGLQMAFSDAIRIDDVVIVEGEWGRIEEITLTYVVVHLWDDRRLVMPTSYFMSKPFENWTRTGSWLLGTVELDLDWTVDTDGMRAELDDILRGTELWDGRTNVLQVVDATNSVVRVRALVSAKDAPLLWDLRCLVRERLVKWIQAHEPDSRPRIRVESGRTQLSPRSPGEETIQGTS
ncbi:mechanosensitive ion channel family protein [Actinophytocola sp.]|uniref:mechanosensitive ion channel family protein n=1 Tax=Actinophytocola sp. TaxID=1872138 RepID=UPI002ED6AD87